MNIRLSEIRDLSDIMSIYENARIYMRQNGNAEQWNNGYPSRQVIEKDISTKNSYVVVDNGEILGVFSYFLGIDPTYLEIDGKWQNDNPYGVIHRIAVKEHNKGIASFVFNYALSVCPELRIDTHKDNIPMQKCLVKNGFTRCGVIYLLSGEPREAFSKTKEK